MQPLPTTAYSASSSARSRAPSGSNFFTRDGYRVDVAESAEKALELMVKRGATRSGNNCGADHSHGDFDGRGL